MSASSDNQKLNDLIDFVLCLKKLEIPYFLTNGTLLGCIRDKRFIEWDNDIDIDTVQSELDKKFDKLINELKLLEFTGYYIKTRNYPKIVCRRESIKISFGGFKETKKYLERASYFYPKEFYLSGEGNMRLASLSGHEFQVPLYSEKLLTYIYGNWKTPMESTSEDEYSTKNHYVRPKIYRKIRVIKYRFLSLTKKNIF